LPPPALPLSPPNARRSSAWRFFQARSAGWRNEHDLVFAEPDGTPLNPASVSAAFVARAHVAGLPPIRLNDLRHSYASAALAAGEHPKVVQERLGHSSVQITLDTYSHVARELGDEAADRIARSILGE
jgi:integrase